jgi:hypothetical protein
VRCSAHAGQTRFKHLHATARTVDCASALDGTVRPYACLSASSLWVCGPRGAGYAPTQANGWREPGTCLLPFEGVPPWLGDLAPPCHAWLPLDTACVHSAPPCCLHQVPSLSVGDVTSNIMKRLHKRRARMQTWWPSGLTHPCVEQSLGCSGSVRSWVNLRNAHPSSARWVACGVDLARCCRSRGHTCTGSRVRCARNTRITWHMQQASEARCGSTMARHTTPRHRGTCSAPDNNAVDNTIVNHHATTCTSAASYQIACRGCWSSSCKCSGAAVPMALVLWCAES